MKVIIAGGGLVGSNIARYLAAAGNDVTVIDQRPELVRKIGDNFDIQPMLGHAAQPSSLAKAGAADADLLIAVTQADEVNMVACQVAHSLFGVPTKIARIRDQAYLKPQWQRLFSPDHLPIDHVISPEVEVAHAIALRLEVPGALNVVPFAEGRVRLLAIRIANDTPIVRTPLRQLTYLFPELNVVCVGVQRGERFFIPDGNDQLLPEDDVHVVIETAQIDRALPAFGCEERISERIVVVGGGNIGLFLASELERTYPQMSIRLIEHSTARAEAIASQFDRVVVLNGDARDPDILAEANVEDAHAVVCVTNDDEINILAGVLARRLGCGRSLALVNNSTYDLITAHVGIDVTINPRETTVSSILQHVRRGRLKSVRTIGDGVAEIYEAEALETSPLVGRPLRDLRPGGDMIVGAIVRGEAVIAPRGNTVVQAHDRVILVARGDALKKVEQLFAVRLDYF